MRNLYQVIKKNIDDKCYEVEINHSELTQRMSAIELSQYMLELTELRLQMVPMVPMEAPRLEGLGNVANDPPWICAYDQMNERAALAIRHPGAGWIGYSLSMKSALDLAARLKQVVSSNAKQRANPN